MPKYITAFFLLAAVSTGCGGGKPKDILSHQAMASLLVDVHLTDGGVYTIPQNPDSLFKYATGRYLAVFKKHHTDSAVFSANLKYYAKQPEELTDIYTQVVESLRQKSDSLTKLQFKSKVKQDVKPR